ncbi:E3 ubiquitin-protein ligase CCNB1IP1-like isoform X2 [Apostichopus japonicus]|uniref:E3 ubiquitin-protein ligase CCNB1IP1-like isoform X2 n=1 Tax=Stichopus japonicus TaxID=307972 RepID=UPI003AB49EBB
MADKETVVSTVVDEMICNYKKCRKRISLHGWVTSCSHIFCDEDGTREFNKHLSCPACDTHLPGKFDIIRIDLSPTEQYKSMVLAGQKPEVILEVCSRAISFWTYQVHQDRVYQEHVATKAKERAIQMEQYYEQLLNRIQAEANSLKMQNASLKREMETTKKQYLEISDRIKEKSRQHQKLQLMYDALRRRTISISNIEPSEEEGNNNEKVDNFIPRGLPFEIPLLAEQDPLPRNIHFGGGDSAGHHQSPAERDFVLQPSISSSASTPQRPRRTVLAKQDLAVQSRFEMEFFGTPTSNDSLLFNRITPGQRNFSSSLK